MNEIELLKQGYQASIELLELNKPGAKLNSNNRKIVNAVLQLLNLNYTGLSEFEKCQLIYNQYKNKIKQNEKKDSEENQDKELL